MGLNDEVDQEFGLNTSDEPYEEESQTLTIHATQHREEGQDVSSDELFTKGTEPRRLPELDADFVIQKSKEDRLAELTEKASEVEQSGGISRDDVIALEALLEEPNQQDSTQATEADDKADEAEEQEPTPAVNKPGVLGHPKLYSEDRSKTEYEPAIQTLKSVYEKQYQELLSSTKDLSEKLYQKGSLELKEHANVYVDKINLFNKKIIKFLDDFGSSDLTDVKCPIKAKLTWADLCGVPVYALTGKYQEDKEDLERITERFAQTKTLKFLEDLRALLLKGSTSDVITSILYGKDSVIVNAARYHIKDDKLVIKSSDEAILSENYKYTVGLIFSMIGSTNLNNYFENNIKFFQVALNDLKYVPSKLEEINTLTDLNLKARLDKLLEVSASVHKSRDILLGIMSNITTLMSLFQVINDYMDDLMGVE